MYPKQYSGMAVSCPATTCLFEIDIKYHSAPLVGARNAESIARHWTRSETHLLTAKLSSVAKHDLKRQPNMVFKILDPHTRQNLTSCAPLDRARNASFNGKMCSLKLLRANTIITVRSIVASVS